MTPLTQPCKMPLTDPRNRFSFRIMKNYSLRAPCITERTSLNGGQNRKGNSENSLFASLTISLSGLRFGEPAGKEREGDRRPLRPAARLSPRCSPRWRLKDARQERPVASKVIYDKGLPTGVPFVCGIAVILAQLHHA